MAVKLSNESSVKLGKMYSLKWTEGYFLLPIHKMKWQLHISSITYSIQHYRKNIERKRNGSDKIFPEIWKYQPRGRRCLGKPSKISVIPLMG